MTDTIHYFNQPSCDPSYYFSLRGMIGKHNLSLMSAKGLFSATSFDLGTRILLKHFAYTHVGDMSILDLGCGYGLVSYFLAHQYTQKIFPDVKKMSIDACDSSPLAVDVTKHNLESYRDQKHLTSQTICSDLLSDPYFVEKKYTTIITNPPFSAGKKTVQAFIQSAYDHLVDGGILWIVVPTNKGAKSYITITESIFGTDKIDIVALEAGYRVRTATK